MWLWQRNLGPRVHPHLGNFWTLPFAIFHHRPECQPSGQSPLQNLSPAKPWIFQLLRLIPSLPTTSSEMRSCHILDKLPDTSWFLWTPWICSRSSLQAFWVDTVQPPSKMRLRALASAWLLPSDGSSAPQAQGQPPVSGLPSSHAIPLHYHSLIHWSQPMVIPSSPLGVTYALPGLSLNPSLHVPQLHPTSVKQSWECTLDLFLLWHPQLHRPSPLTITAHPSTPLLSSLSSYSLITRTQALGSLLALSLSFPAYPGRHLSIL